MALTRNAVAERADKEFDSELRSFVYRHMIQRERAPDLSTISKALKCRPAKIKAALSRLSSSHAFMLADDGSFWRAAPFSVIPTAFPVKMGRKLYWGNCIWDALGIPAMLHKDGLIEAACGCCNLGMTLEVRNGKLKAADGVIHIAVPACKWYEDVVFT
jgi:hypothetical protein